MIIPPGVINVQGNADIWVIVKIFTYFIGLFQPLGCIWPGAELQSKLAARHLLGQWKPKKPIKDLLAKEMANPDVPQLETPRHTITVDDPAFRERLKKELKSCKPALEV
mgnify:CR=1 FL=1